MGLSARTGSTAPVPERWPFPKSTCSSLQAASRSSSTADDALAQPAARGRRRGSLLDPGTSRKGGSPAEGSSSSSRMDSTAVAAAAASPRHGAARRVNDGSAPKFAWNRSAQGWGAEFDSPGGRGSPSPVEALEELILEAQLRRILGIGTWLLPVFAMEEGGATSRRRRKMEESPWPVWVSWRTQARQRPQRSCRWAKDKAIPTRASAQTACRCTSCWSKPLKSPACPCPDARDSISLAATTTGAATRRLIVGMCLRCPSRNTGCELMDPRSTCHRACAPPLLRPTWACRRTARICWAAPQAQDESHPAFLALYAEGQAVARVIDGKVRVQINARIPAVAHSVLLQSELFRACGRGFKGRPPVADPSSGG